MSRILVTGASCQIGVFLLPRLRDAGHEVLAASRHREGWHEGIRWVRWDMKQPWSCWRDSRLRMWIHLAFLPLAVPHLEAALQAGVRRFIGLSSTSIHTKAASRSSREREFVRRLRRSEREVIEMCEAYQAPWTLFRPTMIYGCGMDRNVAFICRCIERFGVFPLAGGGTGLRQPVHARDVAAACQAALEHEPCRNKAYDLGGGETLSYAEMVRRIFLAMGRKPRMPVVPAWGVKAVIRLLRAGLPSRFGFLDPAMVDRMTMDMAFDCQDAKNDFGYDPVGFRPLDICTAEEDASVETHVREAP